MPNQRELDDVRDPVDDEPADEPGGNESISGIADQDDAVFEDDDEDDAFEDDALEDEDATAEVGSEGGSPGDTVSRRRTRPGNTSGSEATSTWGPLDNEPMAVDTRDEGGVPRRRTP